MVEDDKIHQCKSKCYLDYLKADYEKGNMKWYQYENARDEYKRKVFLKKNWRSIYATIQRYEEAIKHI